MQMITDTITTAVLVVDLSLGLTAVKIVLFHNYCTFLFGLHHTWLASGTKVIIITAYYLHQ